MYKIFRMICSIIAAVLVVACIFFGIYLGMLAFWCGAAGVLLFFVLSMFFKYLQEEKEAKEKKSSSDLIDKKDEDENQK